MPEDLKRELDSKTMNNQILDTKEIVFSEGFVEGCTIFGRVEEAYCRKKWALFEATSSE